MWADSRFRELVERLACSSTVESSRIFGVRVPLRACPLGAHVDHQGGVVTGVALDRSVLMAAVPTDEAVFRIESHGFPGCIEVPLNDQLQPSSGEWGDYVRAAVMALSKDHRLKIGLRAVVRGDLPGMGLSSSAAVLLAYLFALAQTNGLILEPERMARLVQWAENSYIGLSSGLLDQSIMLFAKEGHLTHIRCSDFSVEQVSLPEPRPDYEVLVAFSGAPRLLVNTGYNSRVVECGEAARRLLIFAGRNPGPKPLLSQVDQEVYEAAGHTLPAPLRGRAAHFFSEDRRVREGVTAWKRGDLPAFGTLVTASGESSIVNFESGTPPLITLFKALREAPGVFGTRFSGAGFGGSCIALVDPSATKSVVEEVSRTYAAAHPDLAATAAYEICRPAGPAQIVRPEA
ncbi:MAG: hypothetical protein K8R59_10240 [Thermoanaerobaculales bacterium]|nr:hypothetical protein [Thermoanaerobaculales bacterium]